MAKKTSKITTSKKKKRVFVKREAPKPETTRFDAGIESAADYVADDVVNEEVDNEIERENLVELETNDKFPSPKKWNKIFTERWNEYVDDVVKRDNFKQGHLAQLAILCDLYVEYDKLSRLIAKKGYTYKSIGRNGVQYKVLPEVGQLNRTRAEIRSYSKTLGLLLVKDKEINLDTPPGEEKETWE